MRDVRTGSSCLNFMSMNPTYKSIFTIFPIELYFMIKDSARLTIEGPLVRGFIYFKIGRYLLFLSQHAVVLMETSQ